MGVAVSIVDIIRTLFEMLMNADFKNDIVPKFKISCKEILANKNMSGSIFRLKCQNDNSIWKGDKCISILMVFQQARKNLKWCILYPSTSESVLVPKKISGKTDLENFIYRYLRNFYINA